jgi:Zn-dependent peptidase ImmA (M78 family)/DNA-binding XRE family transcriptional regulator
MDAKKTQDQAADVLAVSRPTLISIEKGKRKVKLEELEKLAAFYGASINRLLSNEVVRLDLQGRFRRVGSNDQDGLAALAQLNHLASASVELERLLGIRFAPSYPQEQPITAGSINRQAEEAAIGLRHKLGLGVAPISDINSLLENELGIRVFVGGLPSKIAGLFAYDPLAGACILLNAKHPWERRALTAAHETAHFVCNRLTVDLVELDESASSAEERYANAFAYAFLMPPAAVRKKFQEIVESDRRFTPRHLILMAHAFHVSSEAMCRHMERLELLPRGSYDSMRERGFNREFIRGVLGDLAPTAETPPQNVRLAQLVTSAYRRGLVSEGQLASMLGMDRVEVRRIIDVFGDGEGDEFAIDLS